MVVERASERSSLRVAMATGLGANESAEHRFEITQSSVYICAASALSIRMRASEAARNGYIFLDFKLMMNRPAWS